MPGFPARLKPARVLIAWAQRRADGRFDLHFEPVEFSTDPVQFARQFNQSLERLVRQEPSQYQWEYRRFKNQPANRFRYHL